MSDAIVTLIANVRRSRFHGEAGEVRSGTKHFASGARVTFKAAHWGLSASVVTVVAQHRMSKQLITVDMPRRHLENWRVKPVYSPGLISRLMAGHSERRTVDEWQLIADSFNTQSYFYAFERLPLEVGDVVDDLWADQASANMSNAQASATAQAVAYQDSPDNPIGVGFLSSDRYASTYLIPGLADDSQRSCRRALLVRLGIANQRFGNERKLSHLRVDWSHDDESEPIRIYSEVDLGGAEIRKVECYRSGRCDLAAASLSSGATRVATTPIPAVDTINEDPQFSASPINAQQFERIWVDAHTRLLTVG